MTPEDNFMPDGIEYKVGKSAWEARLSVCILT
jgi:hypothetical protein